MVQDEDTVIEDLLRYLIKEKQNVASPQDMISHLNEITHDCETSFSFLNKALSYELIKDTKQGYILTQDGLRVSQIGLKEFLAEKVELRLLDKIEKESSIRMNKKFWRINVAQLICVILSILIIILGILIEQKVIRF
jgi:L-lactate utilization protein LutC